jgi:Pyruvate/2-oxoacid:ferredoxin oxidoreductase delta subunit
LKPVLDERKCPAEGQTCPAIPACTEGAIQYVKANQIHPRGRIVFDLDKCNECGVCVTACCGSAIELK